MLPGDGRRVYGKEDAREGGGIPYEGHVGSVVVVSGRGRPQLKPSGQHPLVDSSEQLRLSASASLLPLSLHWMGSRLLPRLRQWQGPRRKARSSWRNLAPLHV